MEAQGKVLTAAQVKSFAERLPEAIRYAVEDRSLTGLDVTLEDVVAEELCHPLTEEQLRAIRSCISFSRREAEIVCVPDQASESSGLMKCRVRYAYAGFDTDGNAVDVQAEGALALLCEARCVGDRGWLVINGFTPLKLAEDGSIRTPGGLEARMSGWLRKRRSREGSGFWHGVGTVVETIVEIVLDVIFDN